MADLHVEELDKVLTMDVGGMLCEAPLKKHVQWGIECSVWATHLCGSICSGRGFAPVCNEFAVSAKDPGNPSTCKAHRSAEHIVVVPLPD